MSNNKTIINKTGRVVSVKHQCFENEIAIDGKLELEKEKLGNNTTLRFSFFGSKPKTETTVELEKTFGNQLALYFSSLTEIPMETELSLGETDEVVLVSAPLNIRLFFTMFAKKFCLKRIKGSDRKGKHRFFFVLPSERRKLKRLLLLDLLVLFSLSFVFSGTLLYAFGAGWGAFEKATLAVALGFFLRGVFKRIWVLVCRDK